VVAALADHPALKVPPPGRGWRHRKMGASPWEYWHRVGHPAPSTGRELECEQNVPARHLFPRVGILSTHPPRRRRQGSRAGRHSARARGVVAPFQWKPARALTPARSIVHCTEVAAAACSEPTWPILLEGGQRQAWRPIEERVSDLFRVRKSCTSFGEHLDSVRFSALVAPPLPGRTKDQFRSHRAPCYR
jgi:hypothetical protein